MSRKPARESPGNRLLPRAISVDSQSRIPVAEQIRRQIRRAIAHGDVRPGDQIHPVRDLAALLDVSATTVQRAYTELIREGLIHARGGLGLFASEIRLQVSREMRAQILAEKCDEFLTDAVLLGLRGTAIHHLLTQRLARFTGMLPAREPPRHDEG